MTFSGAQEKLFAGPYHVVEPIVNSSDGVPELYENPYSWNQIANVSSAHWTQHPIIITHILLYSYPSDGLFGGTSWCR